MKSKIAKCIEGDSLLVFKPNKSFYEKTGINKKRWGQLYRGDKSPIQEELQSIANYFSIPITNFF